MCVAGCGYMEFVFGGSRLAENVTHGHFQSPCQNMGGFGGGSFADGEEQMRQTDA